MKYDIESILEKYEDDYTPSAKVPGPRNMYNQGQLVQPSGDGSRPGYAGRDLKGKPSLNVEGKNQYTTRTTKEIQAIIDANPDYITPKNFYEPTDTMQKKGMKKLLTLTDTQNPDVVFKRRGYPDPDPSKQKKRDIKRGQAQNRLEGRKLKLTAPGDYQVHHIMPLAGGEELRTGDYAIVSKEMNAKMSKYNKKINKLVNEAYALDFNKTENLKKLKDINNELFDVFKTAKKDLPKEYKGLIGFNKLTPVLDTFDDQGRQILSAEPVGIDYKKSIAGVKGDKVKNMKKSNIQELINKAPKFEMTKAQTKGIAKKLDAAGFKCQLSNGLTCNDPRAYTKSIKENMAKVQQGDDAAILKVNKLGKSMNAFKGAAKFTGWTLLAELGIAAPLAAVDYAKGANKDEIISNATYGLFGKSQNEQLKEKYSDYGQAKDFQKTYDKLLEQENALDDQTGYGQIINPQNVKNTEKKLMEQSKQFDSVLPPSQGLRSEFDLGKFLNMMVTDQQRDKFFADQKAQRAEEIGILKPSTGLESYDNFMEGGIASLNVNKK